MKSTATILSSINVQSDLNKGEITESFSSLKNLEDKRVTRSFIKASKHGLESICGASCETGAQ